ncbi:MAG: hypothetical protein WBN23_09290 [Woeseia sp.]
MLLAQAIGSAALLQKGRKTMSNVLQVEISLLGNAVCFCCGRRPAVADTGFTACKVFSLRIHWSAGQSLRS